MSSPVAGTLAAVSVTAVTCGAAAIVAVLVSQHERTEARLAEQLAAKEEQLQQAFRERTRLSDQLNEERGDRRLDAERALAAARGGGPPPATGSSGSRMGGRNPDAPAPIALDPRMLGLVPRSGTASSSPSATPGTTTPTATAVAASKDPPESPYHIVTPTNLQAELDELKQADVEGVVRFLHVRPPPPPQRNQAPCLPIRNIHGNAPSRLAPSPSRLCVCAFAQRHNLAEHEAVFRQQKVQGTDLSDVLEPDRHGFTVEAKLECAASPPPV